MKKIAILLTLLAGTTLFADATKVMEIIAPQIANLY